MAKIRKVQKKSAKLIVSTQGTISSKNIKSPMLIPPIEEKPSAAPIYPIITVSSNFSGDIDVVEDILDFSSPIFSNEQILVYQSELGLFPTEGPGEILKSNDYIQLHLDEIEKDMDSIIPDKDFEGFAIIGYEGWSLLWHRAEESYQEAWILSWEEENPDLTAKWKEEGEEIYWTNIAATYNRTCKAFYTATIQQCKTLRPKAKWGFFQRVFRNVLPDGTDVKVAQADNQDISWLFENSDFVCPTLLTPFESVADSETPNSSQQTFSDRKNVALSVLMDSKVIAEEYGIPVIPFLWVKHNGSQYSNYESYLSDLTMEATFEAIGESLVDGVFVWDSINDEAEATTFTGYMDASFIPTVENRWVEVYNYKKLVISPKVEINGGYITSDTSSLIFNSEENEVKVSIPWSSVDEIKSLES